MKTKCMFVFMILFLLVSQTNAGDVESWSIQISGLAHKVGYADFNDMVSSTNSRLGADGAPHMKSMDMTWGLDLEFLFRLNKLQIGFGLGYQMMPDFEYIENRENDFATLIEDYELRHSVHAKVVSLIGVYDILSFSRFTVCGGGGIAYYITSISFDEMRYGDLYGNSSTSVYTRTSSAELGADRFGLKGFIGLETKLSSRISMDFRFNARLAAIDGFVGTQHIYEFYVSNAKPEGKVMEDDQYGAYLVRTEEESGEVFLGPSVDSPLGTAQHAEGVVDLSGFGVQLGLKIHFP